MSAREYVVVEPMRTANIFHVSAGSRAEAIEKVKRNEHDYAEMADAVPTRPLSVRDARLIRKATR